MSAVAWIGDLSTWEVVATVVGIAAIALLGAVTWLVVHLLGQNGRVLLRIDAIEAALEAGAQAPAAARVWSPRLRPQRQRLPAPPPGLPVGTPAPSFKLEGMYGETMTLDALKAQGKPLMLLFTDPAAAPAMRCFLISRSGNASSLAP